jgi:polysaccharide biosynthesis/export protein
MSVEDFMAVQGGTPATQPEAGPSKPWTPGPYRLGPGDVLSVTVSAADQVGVPAQSLHVNENGEISLATTGPVKVGGLSLVEAQNEVKKVCAPQYARPPIVAMEITSYRSIEVIVLGEIRTPAPISLRGDRASILQAILAGGGPTERASGVVTVIPARSPDQVMEVDLNNRQDIVKAAQIGALQESDVLIVERRSADAVYVAGLVNTPGPVPMLSGTKMSALQAITAGGGTMLAFSPKEATLIRRKPSGELFRVKLDLHRIMAGEQADVALAPGDVVLVPHTTDTRIEEFMAKTFIFRWGIDTTWNPWTDFYFRQSIKATNNANQTSPFTTFGMLQPLLPAPITPTP